MIYELTDLLMKMGAPEALERRTMSWHYFDRASDEMAGFAEVSLLDNGNRLVAELKHNRRNYDDDRGHTHACFTESFYLHAERTGTRYRVTKICFDGDEYNHPQKGIVELGLSIFHSRALDISILMVEQAFNKQDILDPAADDGRPFKNVPVYLKKTVKKETWGVVVPFRPRPQVRMGMR